MTNILKKIYRWLKKNFPVVFLAAYIRIKYRNWHFDRYLGRTTTVPTVCDGVYSATFAAHRGKKSQKWVQYLTPYDEIVRELLTTFGTRISLLEIGIQEGGSIQIWREVFGPEARIVGVDIDPTCAKLDLPAEVFIGDSSNKKFLNSIQVRDKPFNLIVDDGSHDSKHQKQAFETLFPLLSHNGLYIVEDTEHSYYWSKHGGYLRRSSFINLTKRTIDKMHKQYFLSPTFRGFNVDATMITSVTFHPGMIIFKKGLPVESRIVETLPRQ
jgi:hypothetical protein